jgi:hypothetical protein
MNKILAYQQQAFNEENLISRFCKALDRINSHGSIPSKDNNVQFVKKVNQITVIFLFEMAFPDIYRLIMVRNGNFVRQC